MRGSFKQIVALIDRSVHPERWSEVQQAAQRLQRGAGTAPVQVLDATKPLDVDSKLLAQTEALLLGAWGASQVHPLLRPQTTPRLRWVHSLSAGVDDLPYELLRQRREHSPQDFVVTHHSGVSSAALAEFCMCAYLHFAKAVPTVMCNQAGRQWKGIRPSLISGGTVGIIGFGSIGQTVAKMAKQGFGMRVIALRNRSVKETHANADEILSFASDGSSALEYLLAESDLVACALPRTMQTTQLLTKEMFSKMRLNAVLVNVGRGNVIDELALADQLRLTPPTGQRGMCAALDVFNEEPLPNDSPLWTIPASRLLITPHTMDQTSGYWGKAVEAWERNAGLFLGDSTGCPEFGPIVDLDLQY